MMQTTFHVYSDPAHGWVKVPEGVLAEMGMSAADFSAYSYVGRGHLFLEEDADATLFCERFKEIHGEYPDWISHNTNSRSRIRSKHSNNPEAAAYFVPSIA